MTVTSRSFFVYLAIFVVVVASSVSVVFAQQDDHIYELRTYTTNPGKRSNALKRLELATPLFIKHGMTVVAYWTPESEKDIIIYLLGHDSKEAARVSWQGFHGDPEWHRLYGESVVNGSLLRGIESDFMVPTEFSPLK